MSIPFPVLHTDRFLLRKFTVDDLNYIFAGLSHPEVIKYYGTSCKTFEDAKGQLKWFDDLEKNKTGLWWAIFSPDEKIFYGATGFNEWEIKHRRAEIGIWLMPEHWGKGIVQEVVTCILKHGHEKLNMHRIEAYIESANANSVKAIKRLGFNYEGTMRDAEISNGKFVNWDIFATFPK